MKRKLDKSALNLLDFFETNRAAVSSFRYTHGHSFPQNCCEGASLIFRYLSQEKFGIDVEVWRGRKRNGEMHLWNVTQGGLIYDLTAHQSDGLKPVVGEFTSVASHRFRHEIKVYRNESFVDRDEVVGAYRAGVIPF